MDGWKTVVRRKRVRRVNERTDSADGPIRDERGEQLVKALASRLRREGRRFEDEYFPPPRNLRDLLQAIRGFAGLGFGAPPPSGHLDDRAIDASDALTALDRLRPAG